MLIHFVRADGTVLKKHFLTELPKPSDQISLGGFIYTVNEYICWVLPEAERGSPVVLVGVDQNARKA